MRNTYARSPPGWEETFQEALATGVPEPYGRNCQQVYKYVSDAIGQIRTDGQVRAAIRAGDQGSAKDRIRTILKEQVEFANQRMLNILTPRQKRIRSIVASIVAVAIVLAFSFVFYRVFKVFTPQELHGQGGWQFGKYKWAYLIMLPALATIALWTYYPLARGTVMAFQDYNVRGFSRFVGMENFANALFDEAFWYSLWISLKYSVMFMAFGFVAPIVLAILLTEVPRGKLLFRTIYYLPAVLTGGGPYTPRGQTEVVGLQIFYQAFFYLRFGLATAMAWILGALLIGFTVMQLQRLSRMEFRTAQGTE